MKNREVKLSEEWLQSITPAWGCQGKTISYRWVLMGRKARESNDLRCAAGANCVFCKLLSIITTCAFL